MVQLQGVAVAQRMSYSEGLAVDAYVGLGFLTEQHPSVALLPADDDGVAGVGIVGVGRQAQLALGRLTDIERIVPAVQYVAAAVEIIRAPKAYSVVCHMGYGLWVMGYGFRLHRMCVLLGVGYG